MTISQTTNNRNIKPIKWAIVKPKQSAKPRFFVSERLWNVIRLHLRRYKLISDSPLILVIQGSSGNGKTSQSLEICSRLNVIVVSLSASSLSGPLEGDSMDTLINAYVYAATLKETYKKEVVLLIDDFDTSVASVGDGVQSTINSQLLRSCLMHITENPTRYGTLPVPIILTGNNFENMYKPLVRAIRMDFFTFEPSLEEKVQTVSHLYGLSPEQIPLLLREFENESIAFFSALRNDYIDDLLLEYLDDPNISDAKLKMLINQYLQSIQVSRLVTLGKVRAKKRPQNCLNPNERRDS